VTFLLKDKMRVKLLAFVWPLKVSARVGGGPSQGQLFARSPRGRPPPLEDSPSTRSRGQANANGSQSRVRFFPKCATSKSHRPFFPPKWPSYRLQGLRSTAIRFDGHVKMRDRRAIAWPSLRR